MKNGDYEGLLLPQVPVEQKWDRQTFLEETCRKAGMNAGCWKDEETDVQWQRAILPWTSDRMISYLEFMLSQVSEARPGAPKLARLRTARKLFRALSA
jgi:hypothetical protein